MVRSEQRYSGYRSPESDSRSKPHFDDRDNMRGRYRGSRNRGRGDRMGHNWDERDRDQYRDIERDNRSPRSFRDRSRSRSPPRNGDRRNTRLHSPIRRPRAASPPSWKHDPSVKGQSEPGKDEFGRDIRSESPKSPMVSQKSASPAPTLSKTLDPRSQPQPTPVDDSKLDSSSSAPSILSTSSSTTNTATTADSVTSELGMESFNLAMFDYTSPASWEALGKMWQVTNGYLPSTEQLMQFVMSYGQQMDSNMQSSNQEFHSSTAFSGMVFLSLWIAGQTAAWCFVVPRAPGNIRSSRMIMFFLTVTPIFWAMHVAITRIQDHVRQWFIFLGSMLKMSCIATP